MVKLRRPMSRQWSDAASEPIDERESRCSRVRSVWRHFGFNSRDFPSRCKYEVFVEVANGFGSLVGLITMSLVFRHIVDCAQWRKAPDLLGDACSLTSRELLAIAVDPVI